MKPFAHQIETTKFLIENSRCHCWNEAGTGKTASAIWAFLYLMKIGEISRVLILCTKSTMENVWWRACFNLCPMVIADTLINSKAQRLVALEKKSNVKIINHDGVKIITEELITWQPDLVIIDESTAIKATRTQRWKATNAICKNAKYVWLLTGTPMPQSPLDLYGQGRLVNSEGVGRSFLRFRDNLMYQVSMYKWASRENWKEIALKMIGSTIRFTRAQCLDLPAITYSNYIIKMSNQQKSIFERIRNTSIAELQQLEGNLKIIAVHEGVVRTKLLQICCGYVYGNIENNVLINNDNIDCKAIGDLKPVDRLEATFDIIEECSHGVLIFAPFVSALYKLQEFLNERKISNAIISGDVGITQRTTIIDEFQEGKIKVIIAHPKTMAHGVNLTVADTVIWYCVTSDNELYEQANARINRIGQTKKMRVIHLLSTKFEEAVLSKLQNKQKMQKSLLEILKQHEY